jgi:hypothetical protein
VLADERFIDSLKELNSIWLELGSPERDLWLIAIKMSELPMIREYGDGMERLHERGSHEAWLTGLRARRSKGREGWASQGKADDVQNSTF